MRYSYGIKNGGKILLYKPHLFLKGDDILVFPTKDFHKWHGDIKEYIDGLYQINYCNGKPRPINTTEFNLGVGIVNNITEELKNIFNPKIMPDFSHYYVSTLDESYKKLVGNCYTIDMRRCDIKIHVKPQITPWLKEKNMMEIVDQVAQDFAKIRDSGKKK